MKIERRTWQWIDWALFATLTFWFGLGLLFAWTSPETYGNLSLYYVLPGLLVSYFVPLLCWNPVYGNQTLLPIAILLTSGVFELYIAHTGGVNVIMLTFPLLLLGYQSSGWRIGLNSVVFLLVFPIVKFGLVLDTDLKLAELLMHMGNYALMFLVGVAIQKVLKSNQDVRLLYEQNLRQYHLIQEKNRALEQYAKQVEQLTLLEERNRLARELHDTVGHTFTSVIMGMDAVAYLLETSPEKAKERLEVLRDVTRKGLEEVRRHIHQMAPPKGDESLSEQLSRLAKEFSIHTGTKVSFQLEGRESPLSKQAELALVRCLQESLTNAKRHGNASAIEAGLVYGPDSVTLTVADNGTGTEQLQEGFGLTSMRERLAVVRGTLQVKSEAGKGTVVRCEVPLQR